MPRKTAPKPAPAPVEPTPPLPLPPKVARPRAWTVAELPGAAGEGERLTIRAYVSPDGLTALQHAPGYYQQTTRARARSFAVSVIVDGAAWLTRNVDGSAEAKRIAAACAKVHAEQADTVAALAGHKRTARAWLSAAQRMKEAYQAAGLY